MTLSEIRRNLDGLGVRPSRRLGQNFLHDQNMARRIVALAEPAKGGKILEIGPGLGALTEFLVSFDPAPVLIEKDFRLTGFLRSRFPQARVIEGDALKEISRFPFPIPHFLVLGNLPYSVASPLMVRLCERDLRPCRMAFTIQKEVALRLAAKPRTADYGLLTLLTRPFYEISIVRKVPPTVFWPVPEVSSAVVILVQKKTLPFEKEQEEKHFHGLVSAAFQKRRKTLGSIFGEKLPPGVDRTRRPEELEIEEWIRLSRLSLEALAKR